MDKISDEDIAENNDNEDASTENKETVYVVEGNPLLRLLKIVIVSVVGFIILLNIIGFIMGLNDIRPPYIDSNIARDRISEPNRNELEKVTQPGSFIIQGLE